MTATAPPVSPDADVAAVVDVLDRDREAIAAQMVASIAASIGAYSVTADSEAVFADVRTHCAAHLDSFIGSIRAGTAAGSADLGFLREAVGRRVRQGVPLDAVLHSFRLGHRTVWDAIVAAAAEQPGGDAAAVQLARPALEYIDATCTCVAETYLAEQQTAMADADRAKRDLLERVLAGDFGPRERLEAGGVVLDALGAHLVVVARLADGHPEALAQISAALPGDLAPAEPLVVVRHDELIAVVPVADAGDRAAGACARVARRAAHRGVDLRFGVGLTATTLADVATGYREARAALERATATDPVVDLRGMPVLDYMLATADQTAQRLVPAAVRDLALSADPFDAALVATMDAYIDSGMNVKRAAAALPAHANTVHYRLRRLAERTGLDPHDVRDLCELSVGVGLARRGA